MARRISDEDAHTLVEGAGFTPLEKYPGSMAKWRVRCNDGHEISKTYTSMRLGHKCGVCEKSLNQFRLADSRRLTDEEARARAESCGFTITDPLPYPGSMEKWLALCSEGHETSIRIGDLPKYGCKKCATATAARRQMIPQDRAIEMMKEFGFTPLVRYTGSKDRWESKCPEGHIVSPSLQNVRRGHGCFVCKTLSHSTRTKLQGSELPGYLYLIRFTDEDGTSFLKVGIGLTGGTSNRLADHGRSGGEVLEVIHTSRELSYTTEQKIISTYKDDYGYRPIAKGSWGFGTECFKDNCPIQLTEWF
jgi:hypothetical protein